MMPCQLSPKVVFSHKIKMIAAGVLAAGSLVISTPAFAGFQWVAPNEAVPPPPPSAPAPSIEIAPPPSPLSMPQATEGPEVISPVVIEGQPLASPPQMPLPKNQILGVLPLAPAPSSVPAKASPTVSVPPALAAPSASAEVVRGFGNNVPLTVALREILPAGYGFSVDQDVDLGTLVSFKGGKSWRETLQDAIRPANLVMREQDHTVSIGHPHETQQAAEQPPALPVTPALQPPTPAPPPVTPVLQPLPKEAAPIPAPVMVQPTPLPRAIALGASSASASKPGPASLVESWTADRSETLHKVLEDWCRRANVEMDWLAEYDYPLQASVSFTGTFEEAVRNLLAGFEEAHPQPVAELHVNPNLGQTVLVIQTRGNPDSD